MVTLRFFSQRLDSQPVAEMSIDGKRVTFVAQGKHHAGELSHGAAERIHGHLAMMRTDTIGSQLGTGPDLVELVVRDQRFVIRLAGFNVALDDASWGPLPEVATTLRVLYRAACTLRATGSLRGFRDGLTAVMARDGLLFRFKRDTEGLRNKQTYALYLDGTAERWRLDDNGWSGTCEASTHEEPAKIVQIHAAILKLLAALAKSRNPGARGGTDPTEHLTIEVMDRGQLRSESFSWGRATINDSPGSPVPYDVPVALFDDVANAIQALPVVGGAQFSNPLHVLGGISQRFRAWLRDN
jgi:hypothetical protein